MKIMALTLNALLGFCDALPYKYSSIPLGALGMLWVPMKAMMLISGQKEAVESAEQERRDIQSEVEVMFAKRAEKV